MEEINRALAVHDRQRTLAEVPDATPDRDGGSESAWTDARDARQEQLNRPSAIP